MLSIRIMRPSARVVATYLLIFLIGSGVGVVLTRMFEFRIDMDWRQLVHPAKEQLISYSTEVFVKSDLPIPAIKELSGKAKFIENANPQDTGVNLGYKISADVGVVDLKKVPKKYLTEKPVNVEGTTITQLAIRQVDHEVHFEFTLKDKDGFVLMEAQSEPHTLESGKLNVLQGVSPTQIPAPVAKRTVKIVFRMSVDKCITCSGE